MPKHKTKGPLTLQGAALPKQAFRSDVSLSLKVLHRDSAAAGRGISALVAPGCIQQLLQDQTLTAPSATAADSNVDPAENSSSASNGPSSCFLQLASGSDCVLHTRPSNEVPPGCIQVDEVQQANLRLCAGEVYSFSVFVPGGQPGAAAAAAAGGADADADADADVSEDESSSDDVDMQPADTAAAAGVVAATAAGDAGSPDSEEGDDAAQQQQHLTTFELTDIDVEVRLLPGPSSSSSSSSEPVQVDGRLLTQAFCKQCFGRVLAVNEYVVVDLPGCPPLLLRVLLTNTLTAEEQQDVLGYHCFRGLLTPDTEVYFITAVQQQSSSTGSDAVQDQHGSSPAAVAADTAQQLSYLTLQQQTENGHHQLQHQQQQQHDDQYAQGMNGYMNGSHEHNGNSLQQQQQQQQATQSRLAAQGSSIQLVNTRQRPPAAAPTNVVNIYTSDEEWFPVKKKLLRPCIALTKAVRDSGDTAPTVAVDIDTLTFDRVLIFLETYALKRKPPRFAVHLLGDLQEAGVRLGLRPLQEYCRKLLGRKQAALSMYSYADIQRANASGKVWLILDGMVLDVGRWLPEHPGGASIIPKQSLNLDCARFFEMYHASKESFLYIEEFYIGELLPSDRPSVPLGGHQPPSQDFLQQLREFTTWRQAMQKQALARSQQASMFKSF